MSMVLMDVRELHRSCRAFEVLWNVVVAVSNSWRAR